MFLPTPGRQFLRKVCQEWCKEGDWAGSCGPGKFQNPRPGRSCASSGRRGHSYFRALPVEVILFGIRARSVDNFYFISLVGGFIPGQFEPLPGGFLRFRKKGGDIPFGAFVKASGLHFVPVGVRAPAFRSVPRAVAGNAVNGSVIVPGQAQEPLPVEGIFLQVGNAVSHCRGFPVPFSGLW